MSMASKVVRCNKSTLMNRNDEESSEMEVQGSHANGRTLLHKGRLEERRNEGNSAKVVPLLWIAELSAMFGIEVPSTVIIYLAKVPI